MKRDSKEAAMARTTNSDGWKFYEEYLEIRKEDYMKKILNGEANIDQIRGGLIEIEDSLSWGKEKKEYKIN